MLVRHTAAGYGDHCTECPSTAVWAILQGLAIAIGSGSVHAQQLMYSHFLLCSFVWCFVSITTNKDRLGGQISPATGVSPTDDTPKLSILYVAVSFFQVTTANDQTSSADGWLFERIFK